MYRHTEWRKLVKKLRRKRVRQKLAEQRKQIEEQGKNFDITKKQTLMLAVSGREIKTRTITIISS